MIKDYSSIYFLKNNIWSTTSYAENQLDSVCTIDRLIKMDQQLFSLTLRKGVRIQVPLQYELISPYSV